MQLRAFALGAVGLAIVATAACAATGSGGNAGTGAGGGSSFGGSTGTSTTTTGAGTGGALFDAGEHDAEAGLDPDSGCGFVNVDAKVTPADVYLVVDKSSSMVGTKWDGATAGLNAFVNDPASTGLGVALNFFPLDNNPTCDQFAYKPPVVPFGLLPGNATAISQALSVTMPTGFSTPIYPALGGAILAALEQVQNNPGHTGSVLLVTDGQPDGPATTCGGVNPDDPAAIAGLASTGKSKGIRTFVIGLPGVNQSIANQIAAAGGTTKAILVTITNVQTEFQSALAQVRGQALPCDYELPDDVNSGTVDTGHVNVQITPTGKPAEIVPQDPTCAGEGWKYDDPSKPTKIIFCPKSCDIVKASLGGNVQILLGCPTIVPK